MRLPEQRLWDRMRAGLAPYGVLLKRIENLVGEGMPDVVAACRGRVTFVELKMVEAKDVPKRDTTPLLGTAGLSPAQRNWHLDWNQAGCRTIIIVGVWREIAAIDGRLADEVNKMPLATLRDASLSSTWDGVAILLRGGL